MLTFRPISIAAFLLYAYATGSAQDCEDAQSWCAGNERFCDASDQDLKKEMRKWCRKTCDHCQPKECDECDQDCIVKADGQHECSCLDGYQLEKNGRNCTDFDECDTPKKPCKLEEVCRNYNGGYECLKDKCTPFHGSDFIRSYSFPEKCCKMMGGNCGRNTQNMGRGRTIGGKTAEPGMWPWQAFIILPNDLCGGSLISNLWVVSAAHCFERIHNAKQARTIQMWFGVTNSTKLGLQAHQKRLSKQIIKHEKYEFPKNDIALLRLNKAITVSDFVRPVCLPNGEIPVAGTRCYTTGFGVTEVGSGRPSETLQQVDVPIVDGDTCKRAYKDVRDVDPVRMVCAGYKEGGKDACQGDSGGPLVCQRCDSCIWYLAGVTSFGEGCAQPEFYGVYSNVEYYETWIESKITGLKIEKKQCRTTQWSRWGDWIKCSASCDTGSQSRIRICLNGKAGLPGCLGNEFERRSCNTEACGVDSWTDWSECSKSCGKGEQFRERVTARCQKQMQRQECNTLRCPTWRNWTLWGECSESCGGGDQTRTRSCRDGTAGQPGCHGLTLQTRGCNEGTACPEWGPWSDWSDCDVSCGGGQQISTRKCENGIIRVDCKGDSRRVRSCNDNACMGVFGSWSKWTECTKSCGGGTQMRTRSCLVSSCVPDKFGSVTTEMRPCGVHKCVGQWTAWSPWGDCSKSCGSGTRIRIRTCHGGDRCVGADTDEEACMTNECIGTWSRWSDWTQCGATCGTGARERTRTCRGGVNCPGQSKMTDTCSLRTCPSWSKWSDWGDCSKTCEGGERTRTRTCGEGSQDDGLCPGSSSDTETCAQGPCKAFCEPYCKEYVHAGFCISRPDWMADQCHLDCCGKQFCKDKPSENECKQFGQFFCGNQEFIKVCLNTCGWCPT